MPPPIPGRLAALSLIRAPGEDENSSNHSADDLIEALSAVATAIRVEWSEELSQEVRRWLHSEKSPRITAYRSQSPVASWSVQSVTLSGREVARILRTPLATEEARVPSAGQEIVVGAFLFCKDAAFVDLSIEPNQILVHWLLADGIGPELEGLVVAAAGATGRDQIRHPNTTALAQQIELGEKISRRPPHELGFLTEAYRSIWAAGEVRWQYLSVYRIFEHAWLRTIFDELNRDFMQSPDIALKNANEALASERAQFEKAVAAHDVRAEFEEFRKKFKVLLATNRFCCAIDKRVSPDKASHAKGEKPDSVKGEEWRTGVRICYQIRCAIVHAGAAGPYYENFNDADSAVGQLLPSLEFAMQKFIGIAVGS